ncbi:MAG: replication initiator protein A [Clostridia bacterium]|nr:replication initiator protein A [Clostridia bacterium]
MRFYKVYKSLFEEEKYKEISLTSKFSYCVYLDRIRQNIDVKVDKEGKKYLENPRDYLMEKLNISINTVTKIHKELKSVGLISDLWEDVGKPKIIYVKDCESYEPKVIHKVCESPKVIENEIKQIEKTEVKEASKEEIKEVKKEIEYIKEFKDKDVEDAKIQLERYKVGLVDLQATAIIKRISFNWLTENETKVAKYVIRLLVKIYKQKDLVEFVEQLDTNTLIRAITKCKRTPKTDKFLIDILVSFLEVMLQNKYSGTY